jgi:hypothetical protein
MVTPIVIFVAGASLKMREALDAQDTAGRGKIPINKYENKYHCSDLSCMAVRANRFDRETPTDEGCKKAPPRLAHGGALGNERLRSCVAAAQAQFGTLRAGRKCSADAAFVIATPVTIRREKVAIEGRGGRSIVDRSLKGKCRQAERQVLMSRSTFIISDST